MEFRFSYLARDRRLGVGLAVIAELSLVPASTLAPAPAESGIPGVIAAAIAGTVAVVFGVVDGVVLALIGAVLFGMIDGWSVGALCALLIWPGVVGAVGLFARRVEQQRDLLGELVTDQEDERRRAALALYDEKAQVLSGALLMLRAAGHGQGDIAAAAAQQARDLISTTITELRTIAGDLSPRALEQHGLTQAVEQLAERLTQDTNTSITIAANGAGQVSFESELALYRLVHDVLKCLIENDERDIRVELRSDRKEFLVLIWASHSPAYTSVLQRSKPHHERLRLLGGHLHIGRAAHTPLISAVVPLAP